VPHRKHGPSWKVRPSYSAQADQTHRQSKNPRVNKQYRRADCSAGDMQWGEIGSSKQKHMVYGAREEVSLLDRWRGKRVIFSGYQRGNRIDITSCGAFFGSSQV